VLPHRHHHQVFVDPFVTQVALDELPATDEQRRIAAAGVLGLLSVAVSAVVGYIFLVALTTHLPDLSTLFPATLQTAIQAGASQYYFGGGVAVAEILKYNLGQLGDLLAAGIAIAMWFCGLASLAAAGRMLFAFSRDDGIPGSGWLKRVSRRYRTPANALTAVAVVAWLFTVAAFIVGTGTAIVIITAVSTIFLYAAYGLVIYLGATTSGWREHRVWSLGRWSKPVAYVAVFWVVVLMILFSFPTSGNISWPFMAGAVVLLLKRQRSTIGRHEQPGLALLFGLSHPFSHIGTFPRCRPAKQAGPSSQVMDPVSRALVRG